MNIFLLDKNPRKCAAYHCDKHVVKMIVESAQMLCATHWLSGGNAPYKLTHAKHPCNLWLLESLDNYNFLCNLGMELCREYTKRYGKIHKTQEVIEWCTENKPDIESVGLTTFPQAMPDKYKHINPVRAYRTYYINEKKGFAKYTNSKVPVWLKKFIPLN
jgi:hypothetical protein